MADIPVENKGNNPLHLRGATIQPGETRFFPEEQVPRHLRHGAGPAPAADNEAEGPDEVLALLDQGVDKITPELPALSDTDLARLEAAEEAGKTRKTLMAAFQEERLRRAQEQGQGGDGTQPADNPVAEILANNAEHISAVLSEVEDGDLTALYEAEASGQARDEVLAAITAEGERRNGQS